MVHCLGEMKFISCVFILKFGKKTQTFKQSKKKLLLFES